jgi:hypothetical protein
MKFVKLSLLFLLLGSLPTVSAACTSATAAGSFGFTTTGTLFLPTGPAPVAAVGAIRFDFDGNAIGSQDRSVGGAFAHETVTGKLIVNRDCTVVLTADVFDGGGNLVRTSRIPGVLVNQGREIRAIFESVILPNGASLPSVLTVEVVRVHGHSQ